MRHAPRPVVIFALAVALAAPAFCAPLASPLMAAQTYKEFWGMAGGEETIIYTVPAGRKLFVTDIVLLRSMLSNTTESNPPAIAILSRLKPGETSGGLNFAAVVRFFVPMGQNVIFSPRTPIEFNAGDRFRIRCGGGPSGAAIMYHIFGYER